MNNNSKKLNIRIIILLVIIFSAFFALGIPNGALGVAFPIMREEMSLPLEAASIILVVMSVFFVVSASLIGIIQRKFQSGKITLFGLILMSCGYFLFAISPDFWMLAVLSAPIGFGMGLIDSSLNDYVSKNFGAKHMNWLHCMWGIGSTASPFVMSLFISLSGWRTGYVAIASIQTGIVVVVLISLLKGAWLKVVANKNTPEVVTAVGCETDEVVAPSEESSEIISTQATQTEGQAKPRQFDTDTKAVKDTILLARPRNQIIQLMIFFLHSGVDVLVGLYAVSVLVGARGVDIATASIFAVVFFGALTVGRFVFGLFADKVNSKVLVRIGFLLMAVGLVLLIFFSSFVSMALVGLGLAPIYPCLMHDTQNRFRQRVAGRLVGFEIAAASVGGAVMSIVAGVVLARINLEFLFPIILGVIVVMCALNEFLEWRLRRHRALDSLAALIKS